MSQRQKRLFSRSRSALVLASLLALALAACEESPPPAYPYEPPLPDGPAPGATEAPPPEPPSQEVQIGVDGSDTYADTDPSALTDFRQPLEGHGQWVDDPTYGTVWVPDGNEVGGDFQPYVSSGHWVYDDDYVWVSDYSWGWAPFHYGRWIFIDGRWAWIPGREYAGAWVTWRMGGEGVSYVGWAPMAPVWGWRHGAVYGYGFVVPPPRYAFCERGEVFSPGIGGRVIVGERAVAIERQTQPYDRPGTVTGGRAMGQPAMHGPPPAALGVDASRVPHSTPSEANTARASAYAHPSTARPAGAAAPTPHVVHVPQQAPHAPPPVHKAPAARAPRSHR